MKESSLILRNFKGVVDSTLREGLQFSRASFSLDQQKKIFRYLARINVDYVEVGNPIKSEVREMIVEIVRCKKAGSPKILAHVRNHKNDLQQAMDCGVDGVNILCTADPERLEAMRRTPSEYLKSLEQNILSSKSLRQEVRVSVEDSFHQPRRLSGMIYDLADALQVERIGLADTLGKSLSWDVYRRVRSLRHRVRADIEGHFHNDLGHSVSNAVSALMAGANWIDTSLLGIGERTGITPLSSLLINLYILDPEIGDRYNLGLLTAAENYISKICHIEMPLNLATNRRNGFAHKAGIHLDALIRFGPHKYEPLEPQVIGNGRRLLTGSLVSGKTSLAEVEVFRKKYPRESIASHSRARPGGATPCS